MYVEHKEVHADTYIQTRTYARMYICTYAEVVVVAEQDGLDGVI